jgi:hypothetical protein
MLRPEFRVRCLSLMRLKTEGGSYQWRHPIARLDAIYTVAGQTMLFAALVAKRPDNPWRPRMAIWTTPENESNHKPVCCTVKRSDLTLYSPDGGLLLAQLTRVSDVIGAPSEEALLQLSLRDPGVVSSIGQAVLEDMTHIRE